MLKELARGLPLNHSWTIYPSYILLSQNNKTTIESSSCLVNRCLLRFISTRIKLLLILCVISFQWSYLYGQDTLSPLPVITDSIEYIKNIYSYRDSAKINDVIAVKLRTSKAISSFNTLFLNGIKLNDLAPWKTSECDRTVFFRLNSSVERLVLQFADNEQSDKSIVKAYFAIGDTSECRARAIDPIYLEVKQKLKPLWGWIMAITLFIMIVLGLWNNILKDDNNLYYSLGRSQLFCWTIVFLISYIYICLRTGVLPDIPASVLIILGISIGTTATAKVVENTSKPATVIDADAKSEGWFLDILSDGSSINIQRFQSVIFNLVFGLIFIQKAVGTNLLPDFDNNTLLLLGISSAAYAGLKKTEATKEQRKTAPPVGTAPPLAQPDNPGKTKPQEEAT